MANDLSPLPLPARRRREAEPAKLAHARADMHRDCRNPAGPNAA